MFTHVLFVFIQDMLINHMIDYMICDGDTGKWRKVWLGFKLLYLRILWKGLRPLINHALI